MPYPEDSHEQQMLDHMGELDEIQEDSTDLEEKIAFVEQINPREDHDCHAGPEDGCDCAGYASQKDYEESIS